MLTRRFWLGTDCGRGGGSGMYSWNVRLPVTKTPLERTWLYHEMGRCHFELGNYHRARELGERSYHEATLARDKVWLLSSSILTAQAQGEVARVWLTHGSDRPTGWIGHGVGSSIDPRVGSTSGSGWSPFWIIPQVRPIGLTHGSDLAQVCVVRQWDFLSLYLAIQLILTK